MFHGMQSSCAEDRVGGGGEVDVQRSARRQALSVSGGKGDIARLREVIGEGKSLSCIAVVAFG
jgi:hypothetical protein